MGERQGYRVIIRVKNDDGVETDVWHDLQKHDSATRAAIVAALLELGRSPVRTSRSTFGFQRFEFPLAVGDKLEVRQFVCPFKYLADEETLEILRIFDRALP